MWKCPQIKNNPKNVGISQTSSKEYIHPFVKEPHKERQQDAKRNPFNSLSHNGKELIAGIFKSCYVWPWGSPVWDTIQFSVQIGGGGTLLIFPLGQMYQSGLFQANTTLGQLSEWALALEPNYLQPSLRSTLGALWPWMYYLTALCLGFLICKTVTWSSGELLHTECTVQCLGSIKRSMELVVLTHQGQPYSKFPWIQRTPSVFPRAQPQANSWRGWAPVNKPPGGVDNLFFGACFLTPPSLFPHPGACSHLFIFFCIFKTFNFILEYSWWTMLWEFQVESKGTQPYLSTYPFFPKLPSHPGWHRTLSRVPCLAPFLERRAVCQSGLLQCFVMQQSKILCYQSKRQNDWELTPSSSSLCSEHSHVHLIEGVIFHRYFCKLLWDYNVLVPFCNASCTTMFLNLLPLVPFCPKQNLKLFLFH